MKKLFIGAVALVWLVANGPARAEEAAEGTSGAAPGYSWTGVYIGAHIGYGSFTKNWHQTSGSFGLPLDHAISSFSLHGVLGGPTAGFNWQFGSWVLGLEGDFSGAGLARHRGHVVFPAYAGHSRINWLATIAPRIGFALDRALLYFKGGGAFAEERHFISFFDSRVTNKANSNPAGWTTGGGLEYAFWSNWSAKMEYNYMHFRSHNYRFNYFTAPPTLIENWDISEKGHVAKFGVNYKFSFAP